MRIHVLNESKQGLGGGWSFIRNFKKGMTAHGLQLFKRGCALKKVPVFVDDWRDADIVFIPSATMATRDTVSIIKGAGKKIVVRLDNLPRNSRNRGAGTSRLFDITQMADMVIYQSQWAREYLMPFVKRYGEVIYNGVDTEIFNPNGEWLSYKPTDVTVLYSRYNRDETKGWERAWYEYQMIDRKCREEAKTCSLVLMGRFSDEIRQYNFDFYNGEEFTYIGVIEEPESIANVMRGCDILLAPYFNDCYSNTIQEALACGLELQVDMSGGTPELLKNGVIDLETMVINYYRNFNELL